MKFIPTTSLVKDLEGEILEFKHSKSFDELSPAKLLKTLFVSTYVPRKCGIATFTRDLTSALNKLPFIYPTQVMVMDNPNTDPVKYPMEAKIVTNQQLWQDYLKAIRFINNSDI